MVILDTKYKGKEVDILGAMPVGLQKGDGGENYYTFLVPTC